MKSDGLSSPEQLETVAELRSLYRSAEARAARLRLLIEAGRELSTAEKDQLPEILRTNARRAAFFAGYRDGEISTEDHADGVPLIAPGVEKRQVGTLQLIGEADFSTIQNTEDGEALAMLAQLIAAAIDRAARERERDDLLAALRDREQRLEQVVERLFSAQEDERRYVSRELHDGVAQTATALFRRLDACQQNNAGDKELALIAQGLVKELRRVIAGLRPTALDDLGLAPAINTLAEELGNEGYDVSFFESGSDNWPAFLTTAYYRIAQEAISNIRKHAGGSCRVEISLIGEVEKGIWKLIIRDFGLGMQPSPDSRTNKGQHVGIEMMRERMAAAGGTLDIASCKDGGISVKALVKVPR